MAPPCAGSQIATITSKCPPGSRTTKPAYRICSGETPLDDTQSSERASLLVETSGLKKIQLYDSFGPERNTGNTTYVGRRIYSNLATQSAAAMYVDVVIARAYAFRPFLISQYCLSTFITLLVIWPHGIAYSQCKGRLYGRRYSTGPSAQKLTRGGRDSAFSANFALWEDYGGIITLPKQSVDVDMKNAHPELLLNEIRESYHDCKLDALGRYCANYARW